jgi:Type VI secretion system/phage-baseplate injector OB domain
MANSEHSFYGIYRGICYDNNDPTLKNRIKVQVPQVLGQAVTDWASPCLPVVDNANHPDHQPHTAAQIAALLTTTPTGVVGGTGGGTVPALTVVAKAGAGTLTHPHKTTVDVIHKLNGSSGVVFNDATSTFEHTPHRSVPNVNQGVWVMFEGGDPNFPVWMGVF